MINNYYYWYIIGKQRPTVLLTIIVLRAMMLFIRNITFQWIQGSAKNLMWAENELL